MRPRRCLAWVGGLFAGFALVATALADDAAQGLERSEAAFTRGDFLAAAQQAEVLDTAESRALAARALLAHCLLRSGAGDIDGAIDRAIGNAQSALDRDPQSVDARLQLALAYGLKGRRSNLMEAFAGRYAAKGRRLIDEALSRDPGEPFGYALLGAWHLEVLRRGGSAGAKLYGAKLEEGIAAFERALALSPDDPTLMLMYGVSLIELDPGAHGARAERLFLEADGTTGGDAMSREARAEAELLARTLREQGAAAAAALAARRLS